MSRYWLLLVCVLSLPACEELQKASMTEEQRGTMQAAETLEKKGNWIGAAATYRQMLMTSDHLPDSVYSRMATAYRKAGQPEEAIVILRDVRSRDPDNTAVLSQLAYALIDAGKSEEAVAIFDQLTAIEPSNALFFSGKGVAFDSAGNHVAAQELYQTALKLSPGSMSIKNNLALSYILSGEPGEAITLLEPLVALPEANATMRQNLALAYGLKGYKEKARRMSGRDLTPQQVEENLRFYEKYKRLSKTRRVD